MELSAVESIAKFAQIQLQMLCAGSVIGTVNKRFRVTNDAVQPFQQVSVNTEILVFVDIPTLSKRLTVTSESVRLHCAARSDISPYKAADRRTLDVISGTHLQINRMPLLIFGNGNKYRLISCSTALFSLHLSSEIGIIKLYDTLKIILLIPHFHGTPDPAEHIPGGFIADLNLAG